MASGFNVGIISWSRSLSAVPGSLVSLWYQMPKRLKVRWVQSIAHVPGFELSYWFFLLFWAVNPLSGVAKPWMDPILMSPGSWLWQLMGETDIEGEAAGSGVLPEMESSPLWCWEC